MTQVSIPVKIKKISPTAKTPEKNGSSFILFSDEATTIEPDTKKLVSTSITMAIPNESYGQLFIKDENRFSDQKYLLLGGVIDSDYRGEVKAIIYNDSDKEISIPRGVPLCNIVFVKILTDDIFLVNDLAESERGESGFGSTGY